MNQGVLLLAYMFPPIVDGGAFRPAAFARYLPEFGYDPIVITRPDSANLPTDASQLASMPQTVRIERLNQGFIDGWTAHYRRRLGWLRPVEVALRRPSGAIADAVAWRVARRYEHRPWEVTWMEPAVAAGALAIEQHKPKVILATAPPYESLKAGWRLHKKTGLPLVVDFRDPWTWGLHWTPTSEKRAREERAWEARVMADASLVLVVTPSMQKTMSEMYPEQAAKIRLLMNGYEDARDTAAAPPGDRFVLSYAGMILERRLPPALFEGLRRLRARHPETAAEVRVQLIGANHTNRSLPDRLREERVDDMVEWVGAVTPDVCRTLLRSSHVLLHIEGAAQYAISGKLFEYLSSDRQVLGLVPFGSDDEWFLTKSGGGTNTGLDDPDLVASAIHARWEDWRANRVTHAVDRVWLAQFHRREQTRELASLLGSVIDNAARKVH